MGPKHNHFDIRNIIHLTDRRMGRTIRSKSFLIILAAMLSAISAGPVSGADTWLRITSQNFELVGNAPESEIRSVALELEQFRSAIGKTLGSLENEGVRVRVVVFRDAASFAPFRPRLAGGRPDHLAAGYFQAGEDLNYIAITTDASSRSFGTIFHEYGHLLIQHILGRNEVPPWLNEGLAEYLQTFRVLDGASAEIGGMQAGHIRLLRSSPLMPWDRFFAVDHYTLQQSGDHSRTIFYAQAWALMHSLVRRHESIPLRQLVRSLSDPSKTAAGALAELGITDLDDSLRTAIDRSSESFVPVKLTIERSTAISGSVEMLPSAFNAVAGDLLFRLRDPAAEVYLRRALTAEPADPEANTTLGMLRLRERRFDESRQAFERALAGGKKNYLVHYYLAYLLSREHMDEFGMITRLPPETARRMRRGLAASIDLNPRFAESYKLLALVGLITGDDLDGALKFLDKAADLHPGNAEHSLLRAQVLMRLDRTDEARDAARLVLRTTVDRNQRARAAEIIRSADEYAAGLKVQKQNLLTVTAMGASDPIIFKRKDLTDDQIRKMDEDRDIANLNVLLDRSGPGEQTAVGYIEQIGCSNGRINYRIKTNTGVLNLSGKSFSDLKVKVLLAGTRSFSFSCGAEFSTELAALRFRPAASPTARDQGTLTALTFVPKNFRPMSYDEIAYNRRIIIEGRPASDLEKNARTSAAEIAEMERVERETRLKQIEERLRPPEADETRITGIAEKVLCSDGLLSVTVRSGERSLILQTPIMKMSKIEIQSLSPDAGLASLDCRSGLPPVNAVFTFTRRELSKSQYDEIVAIEFVPAAFKLP